MAKREISIYLFSYKRKNYLQSGRNLFLKTKKKNIESLIRVEDYDLIIEMAEYFKNNPDKLKIKLPWKQTQYIYVD